MSNADLGVAKSDAPVDAAIVLASLQKQSDRVLDSFDKLAQSSHVDPTSLDRLMQTYDRLVGLQAQAGAIALAYSFNSPWLAVCATYYLALASTENPAAQAVALRGLEEAMPKLMEEISGKSAAAVRDACAKSQCAEAEAEKAKAEALLAESEARMKSLAADREAMEVAARKKRLEEHAAEYAELDVRESTLRLKERETELRSRAAEVRAQERKNEKWYETLCSVA
ncbi:MAG: hypothetical protein LBF24_00860 [Puniceicoccales bacterium]|nr:hypothetical protein [Puniceicoccales bacterium]